jgi:ParB-like nuclease family protein
MAIREHGAVDSFIAWQKEQDRLRKPPIVDDLEKEIQEWESSKNRGIELGFLKGPLLHVHPLAEYTPSMAAEEYQALVESIREHGLREPIITYEGRILDGRHRYKACMETHVEVKIEPFRGDDPVGYVLSKNIHHRHLSQTQKAVVGLKLLPQYRAEAKARQLKGVAPEPGEGAGATAERVAKMVGVGKTTMESVMRVHKHRPELLDFMARGDLTATAAEEKIKEDMQRISARSEELAKMVEDGDMEMSEALEHSPSLSESQQHANQTGPLAAGRTRSRVDLTHVVVERLRSFDQAFDRAPLRERFASFPMIEDWLNRRKLRDQRELTQSNDSPSATTDSAEAAPPLSVPEEGATQ